MIRELIVSLAFTLAAEIPVLLLLGVRRKDDLLTACYANILTNPLVVYISQGVWLFAPRFFWLSVAVLEVLAVVTEGFIYKKYLHFDKVNPWSLAVVANVISFELGFVLSYFQVFE